jgi:hypothetical protein
MQTRVRASAVLASPETDIDQMIEAHTAVVAGLKRLIERNCEHSWLPFGAADRLPNCSWRGNSSKRILPHRTRHSDADTQRGTRAPS